MASSWFFHNSSKTESIDYRDSQRLECDYRDSHAVPVGEVVDETVCIGARRDRDRSFAIPG